MDTSRNRIAVSGVGGGVGQSVLKSLRDTDYEVIALDGEPLAVGLYAAKTSHIIPYATAPNYIEKLLEICKAEGCALLFPGLDAELPILSKAIDRFTAIGTQVVVSSPEVVAVADNKLLTYTKLSEYGVSVPMTVDMSQKNGTEEPVPYPFILKIKEGGARSQDVHVIKDQASWQSLIASNIDLRIFVAQQYIEGDEYTCGSINLDGECKGVIVMRRILRDGDTYKCFSEKNPVIESEVRKIMAAIKPFGACNVQLRLQDGKPYVFEINARCSGTTAARALCGFNEPEMIADYLLSHKEPTYEIKEQTILRYWKELVVANEQVDTLKQAGTLRSNSVQKL